MRAKREDGVCPGCGEHGSTIVVEHITPGEAEALSGPALRDVATVTCRSCGYWYYRPLHVSWRFSEERADPVVMPHQPARAPADPRLAASGVRRPS